VSKSDDKGGEMMPFLYKERKLRESTMSGVFKMADYTGTSATPELREKIKPEVDKRS
jgi:hypothetical protein